MEEILNQEQKKEVDEQFEDEYGEIPTLERFPDVEEVETDIDITISKEVLKFDMFTKNSLSTKHLILYDDMNKDLGLDGESYEPFKKALWYYEHSLMQPTISYKINLKTKADNKFHLLGISSPSGGKTTTKNQIKRIMKDYEEDDNENGIIEVSGLSHPEQLVGKMKTTGRGADKKTFPVFGILHYKAVLYDEAQDLLNEKNDIYAKAQRIKRIAMDVYGDNIISKKLVDDLPENILEYPSPSRILDFAHPVKLESPFFDTGSFRRYFSFNLTHDTIISLSDVTDFKIEDKTKIRNYSDLIKSHYNNKRVNVKFTQKTLNIISHYHNCLLYYLLKHKNPNAFRYGLLNRYSLRNMFCKNILILAMANNERTPSVETTINACIDTLLFVFKTIETLNDLGDMSISSDVWGGLGEQDAQALEYLWRKKSIDRDSSKISIKKFWTILGHLYGCKVTQSRAHYYRLKKNGFIDSKRAGDDPSKVWLKFIPKEIKLEAENYNPLKFWDDKKIVTVGRKKGVLAVLKQVFIDDKTYQKRVTDGSVGVLGCMFINNAYTIQYPNNKNKNNNIYTGKGGVQTPSVPTLALKTKDLQGKSIKSNCQKPKNRPTVTQSRNKEKTDRDVQFYDAEECKNIKPNHSKKDILNWYKQNPETNFKELVDKFGIHSLKFRNELIREGLIK